MALAIAYALGLLTLPVFVVLRATAEWAFAKTRGIGACQIDGCGAKGMELGEHYNITVWWYSVIHGRRRWHRRAVLAYWQDQRDRGRWVHPKARKRLR